MLLGLVYFRDSMIWHALLGLFLVFGTTLYLLRRKLAVLVPEHNRFVNWFFYLGVLYPAGLVVALIMRPNLMIGWHNFLLLMAGELVFPLISILSYRASQDIDAGLFTIISNVAPVITIVLAGALLQEHLSSLQGVGAVLIIFSACLASWPGLFGRRKSKTSGIIIAFCSIVLLGMAVTYERYMLTRVNFGAYLVFGWGWQTLWMTVLAFPERKHLYLLKQPIIAKYIVLYGLAGTFQGLCFVAALALSGSAPVVAATRSFLAVTVVLAAYYVLHERGWLMLKISAAFVGAVGLIVLNMR